ncbi:MAG: hypothetical protein AAFX94_25475, partial [Myxococcota bacterium]
MSVTPTPLYLSPDGTSLVDGCNIGETSPTVQVRLNTLYSGSLPSQFSVRFPARGSAFNFLYDSFALRPGDVFGAQFHELAANTF